MKNFDKLVDNEEKIPWWVIFLLGAIIAIIAFGALSYSFTMFSIFLKTF